MAMNTAEQTEPKPPGRRGSKWGQALINEKSKCRVRLRNAFLAGFFVFYAFRKLTLCLEANSLKSIRCEHSAQYSEELRWKY